MVFLKHTLLFIMNYIRELQRKWKSLPLLLLYPIIFLALITVIIVTIFTPEQNNPIQVGLIDLDQTEETELVVDMLDESSQLGSFIHLHKMTEEEASKKLDQNELSAYVTFPPQFTNHLYQGTQVELELVGNPNRQIDSLLVKEFIDSITRHIRASQANILTINHYAKMLPIDQETRSDFLFEQFKSFFLYTLDKDRFLDEHEVTNYATDSSIYYFAIGSWFIIVTIWLLNFYTLLYQEETTNMTQRLSLYGVLHIQRSIARIIVALTVTTVFAILLFYGLQLFLPFHLFMENYIRLIGVMLLYSLFYLLTLAIIEVLFTSHRIRLFIQAIYTVIIITVSGAIIPSMYFPFNIQFLLPYLFSYEAFYWVQEILLNERLFAEYLPLILMNGVACLILMSCSLWKERLSQ